MPPNNRKENYTPLVTSKSQPSHIPTSRTHLRSQIQGHFNGNQPKALRNVTNHLPTPNKHKLLKTTNSSTMISPPQHAAINHSLWIDRLLHGKPCAKYGLSTCNQITSVSETTHDETIAATSKKLLLCSQPKRLKPYEPSAQGRNPPANEHRPQPHVETATARCHSSHHNDSQTVSWSCQNWQQHQMISPWKMKMTVNQGNQLFTRCSFFTCKESPLEALFPGSIEFELIQYEFSDEVKTSVHCVPEENCQTYRLGKVVWPSAKCMGDFAPSNADVFTDKSLVKLGSGTGFFGLTAAHICSRVVLTDNSNFPNSAHIQTAKLAWGKGIDEFTKEHGLFDIVAGTDVVYGDSALICPLFVTAARLLQENGVFFLLDHRFRAANYEDTSTCAAAGRTTTSVAECESYASAEGPTVVGSLEGEYVVQAATLKNTMHTLKIPLPSWEGTQRPSCPVGIWHEGGHHHTKDVLLHLRRALCQKEVFEPRRDLAERSLNPDETWLEGGHHHTKVVELKRSLEKRAVGGQTFMSGFTAGRSIYSHIVRVLLIQRRVLRHTERALCLGSIWQHYAPQTVKLQIDNQCPPDSLTCDKATNTNVATLSSKHSSSNPRPSPTYVTPVGGLNMVQSRIHVASRVSVNSHAIRLTTDAIHTETGLATIKTLTVLPNTDNPIPGGTWWFRCYTRQPFHLDRTPLNSFVYPPATHTPRRIRGLVDNKVTAAAQTLAKWLVIHGLTTVFPHTTLCIAGVSLISNIQRERAQGAVSRRHKLALGVILLMAHVAVGESVKTCAKLPINEVESRAQKTILDCFLAYPRKRSKKQHGYDSEEEAPTPSQLFPAPTTRGKRGNTHTADRTPPNHINCKR